MSFLHCFFTIRPDYDYIAFLIRELKMDVDEYDVNELTAFGHVYKEQD